MKRAHKIGHCTSVAASTRQRGGANRAGSELNWGNSACLVDSEELELGMPAVNQGVHRASAGMPVPGPFSRSRVFQKLTVPVAAVA
jgi:hypothetical protein